MAPKVFAINPLDFDLNFDLAGKTIAAPAGMVEAVLKLAKAANDDGHMPDPDGAGWQNQCHRRRRSGAQSSRSAEAGRRGRDFR